MRKKRVARGAFCASKQQLKVLIKKKYFVNCSGPHFRLVLNIIILSKQSYIVIQRRYKYSELTDNSSHQN